MREHPFPAPFHLTGLRVNVRAGSGGTISGQEAEGEHDEREMGLYLVELRLFWVPGRAAKPECLVILVYAPPR